MVTVDVLCLRLLERREAGGSFRRRKRGGNLSPLPPKRRVQCRKARISTVRRRGAASPGRHGTGAGGHWIAPIAPRLGSAIRSKLSDLECMQIFPNCTDCTGRRGIAIGLRLISGCNSYRLGGSVPDLLQPRFRSAFPAGGRRCARTRRPLSPCGYSVVRLGGGEDHQLGLGLIEGVDQGRRTAPPRCVYPNERTGERLRGRGCGTAWRGRGSPARLDW